MSADLRTSAYFAANFSACLLRTTYCTVVIVPDASPNTRPRPMPALARPWPVSMSGNRRIARCAQKPKPDGQDREDVEKRMGEAYTPTTRRTPRSRSRGH